MDQLNVESTADREVVIARDFDAPRELVWKVWTKVEHVDRWWGPNGFRNVTHSMDLRVGGQWIYTMHGPDGVDYPNVVTYLMIEPPKRLVYDHGDDGNPKMFQATVTFDDLGRGRTRVTLRSVFPSAAVRDQIVEKYGAIEGGKQTLARAAEYLARMSEGERK